jgi:hypothetical protein
MGAMALLGVWMVVGSLFLAMPLSAQTAQEEAAVERAVVDIFRHATNRDADAMYDLLAPESRMAIPRQAFRVWLEDESLLVATETPQIRRIDFESWESALTGTEYEDVAIVSYRVPVASATEEDTVRGEMVLHNDGGVWRWFFASLGTPEEDIAELGAFTVEYESPYRTEAYRNIDLFWAQMFANAGLDYHPPRDMLGVRVEPVRTGCGLENDIEQMAVYYCMIDETIYYDPNIRDLIVDNLGEFAWTWVISHEWAHHVQNLLHIDTSFNPELDGTIYTIESELMADCLAGMFTQDARVRGYIDDRDVDAAVELVDAVLGDSRGTSWDDPLAHGTGAQRQDAFWLGFNDGLRGCHVSMEEAGG